MDAPHEDDDLNPGKEWVLLTGDEALSAEFAREFDLHPLVAPILVQRGIHTMVEADAFLNPSLTQMHDPFLMKGMKEAVALIIQAVEDGLRIVIHGDYDVDGITSASVLYEFLRDIGADANYFIPRRNKEGYGLNIETIRRIQHEGAQVLITTDCGISNVDEIVVAKALGLQVVVVDHHTVPEILPPADAILNPLQPGCDFPFKKLAAVGVAFNLVVGLRSEMRRQGVFKFVPEPDLKNYLDLVALGTIADVVPLVDENRLFARFGLDVLSKRRRAGVAALIERACNDLEEATTQTVSFQLAPRLNAAGRMGDASICVDLLTTRSYAQAVKLAGQLEEMNKARQLAEREIMKEALIQAEEQVALARPILIVFGEEWNRGVLGIVASRLMEKYGRPALLMGIEDGLARGSARSTAGINLIAALTECDDLLQSYGGHTSAAGVAIQARYLDEFCTRMPNVVARMLATGLPRPQLTLSGEVDISELDLDVLKDIQRLAPFGMANPEPIFLSRPLKPSRPRIVGKRHLRARFYDTQNNHVDGIGFSMSESKSILDKNEVGVVFVPKLSTRVSPPRLELHLKDVRPIEFAAPERTVHIESTVEPVQEDDTVHEELLPQAVLLGKEPTKTAS